MPSIPHPHLTMIHSASSSTKSNVRSIWDADPHFVSTVSKPECVRLLAAACLLRIQAAPTPTVPWFPFLSLCSSVPISFPLFLCSLFFPAVPLFPFLSLCSLVPSSLPLFLGSLFFPSVPLFPFLSLCSLVTSYFPLFFCFVYPPQSAGAAAEAQLAEDTLRRLLRMRTVSSDCSHSTQEQVGMRACVRAHACVCLRGSLHVT